MASDKAAPLLGLPAEQEDTPRASPSKHTRLASLDIVRGFAIALMIYVDELGGSAFPRIGHSAWFNVTLADFVMPWFLFIVGTAMAFSLRRYRESTDFATKREGSKKVCIRAIKLYLLGLVTSGGGWIKQDRVTWGFHLNVLRLCGILNRIAFAYLAVGLAYIWLPRRPHDAYDDGVAQTEYDVHDAGSAEGTGWLARVRSSPHYAVFARHAWHWCHALGWLVLYFGLLFGTFVPSWTARFGDDTQPIGRWSPENSQIDPPKWPGARIECDVRGSIDTPECCAAGYYDRMIFGERRLGVWMSKRLNNCSPCHPADWNSCCVQGVKTDPATNASFTAVGTFDSIQGWLDSGPHAAAPVLDGNNNCFNSTDAEQSAGFHELAAYLEGGAHPPGVSDGLLRFEFIEQFITNTTGEHGAAPPWCFAATYDPEGFVPTLATVLTTPVAVPRNT